jgi:hypothetical protein
MASRLARKFATNKHLETKGILYEEVDDDGPLFQVRLARVNAEHSPYQKRLNELMKPYRKIKLEEIPDKKREEIFLKAFCECGVLPNTWQTWINGTEENDPGKYADGVEDPDTGELMPATAVNYFTVLSKLPELKDRLLAQSLTFDNYRVEALEAEAKNS